MRLRVSDEQVSARAVPANPGLVLLVLKEVAQLADEWLQVGAELVNSLGRRIKLQLSTHGHLLDLLDLFGFFVLVCWHRRRYREVQSLRVRPRRAPRRNRWCGGCTLRWRRQWEFGIRREQKRRPIRLLYVAETSLERMDRILAWTRCRQLRGGGDVRGSVRPEGRLVTRLLGTPPMLVAAVVRRPSLTLTVVVGSVDSVEPVWEIRRGRKKLVVRWVDKPGTRSRAAEEVVRGIRYRLRGPTPRKGRTGVAAWRGGPSRRIVPCLLRRRPSLVFHRLSRQSDGEKRRKGEMAVGCSGQTR